MSREYDPNSHHISRDTSDEVLVITAKTKAQRSEWGDSAPTLWSKAPARAISTFTLSSRFRRVEPCTVFPTKLPALLSQMDRGPLGGKYTSNAHHSLIIRDVSDRLLVCTDLPAARAWKRSR